jgi:hypothetical protein
MTKSKGIKKTSLEAIREYVGKTGKYQIDGMTLEVKVIGYTSAYGHDILTITPKNGEGQKTVRADKLLFI